MWKSIRNLAGLVVWLALPASGWSEESVEERAAAEARRLDVSRAWSDDGGRITSQALRDGKQVLHGVQVVVGPKNWLKEFAVYNQGALEQRAQFYLNGRSFREQRREENGDGSEVIYGPELSQVVAAKAIVDGGVDIGPIKTQAVIAQGQIKNDKRWAGTFLVPVLEAFAFKLMLQEFREGKLIASSPFPIEKLALPKEHRDYDTWMWAFPDWPTK